MAPGGSAYLNVVFTEEWCFAALPETAHLPRGHSVGLGRTCRRPLFDLMQGLISFMAKRPIRQQRNGRRIVRRESIWRPPRDCIL